MGKVEEPANLDEALKEQDQINSAINHMENVSMEKAEEPANLVETLEEQDQINSASDQMEN
eukprot:14970131-Ditylum_brightwellii.AAC.1